MENGSSKISSRVFRGLGLSALITVALMASNALAAAAPGKYKIDTDHTNIGFNVSHLGFSLVVGRFNTFTGTFEIAGENSKVDIEINTASVDTNVEQRDDHLRKADFFDVAIYPKMTFKSTKVAFDNQGNATSIDGILDLHGVKKPVTLEVTPIGDGVGPRRKTRAGFQASATILRSEFGMDNLLMAAGDEVEIIINVEGIKQ